MPLLHTSGGVIRSEPDSCMRYIPRLARNGMYVRGSIKAAATALCLILCARGQSSGDRFEIDATNERVAAQKGMSNLCPRNARVPISLDISVPAIIDGQLAVEFVLTNISQRSLKLPMSLDGSQPFSWSLRLDLTSSDGAIRSTGTWCAQLFARSTDPGSVMTLKPRQSVLIHARCRFPAPSRPASLRAHSTLFEMHGGTSSVVSASHSRPTLLNLPTK